VIKPVNRYIQVTQPELETQAESQILLPADFKPEEERYKVVTIESWAADVRFADQLEIKCRAVVDASMIEEIKVQNGRITVVQDNYVIAILAE
jgi:co-chaperonin GroES (HSP10)|tara:strand:- start:1561 stop:1839 length:279 start_codon:yes stop_codon:yes gene_type:complete